MLLLACEKDQNLSSETSQQTISARSSVPGGFDYVIPNDLNDKQLVLEKVEQLEGRYHLYEQDSLNPGTTADIEWENAVWYAEALYNFLSRYETWPEDKHADFFNSIESSANLSFTVSSNEAFVSEADLFTLLDELTDYTGQDIAPTTDLAVNSVDGSNLVVSISRIPLKVGTCQTDPIQTTDESKAIPCELCFSTAAPRKCITGLFFDAMDVNCHSEALEWFYNFEGLHIGARPVNSPQVSTPDPSLYYVLSNTSFNPINQTVSYFSVGTGTSHKNEFWGASTAMTHNNRNNPLTCLKSNDLIGLKNKAEAVVSTEQNSLSAPIWYALIFTETRDTHIDNRHIMNVAVAYQGLTPAP